VRGNAPETRTNNSVGPARTDATLLLLEKQSQARTELHTHTHTLTHTYTRTQTHTHARAQIPANLMCVRLGVTRWFTLIMLAWGAAAAAFTAVRTAPQFYALRLVLGAAEAGTFPGAWHALSLWLPPDRVAYPFALLGAAVAISQVWRAPLPSACSCLAPRVVLCRGAPASHTCLRSLDLLAGERVRLTGATLVSPQAAPPTPRPPAPPPPSYTHAQALAAPLSALLLSLDGAWGLRGWQWVFLGEALPSMALACALPWLLPDGPHQRGGRGLGFLTPEELDLLRADVRLAAASGGRGCCAASMRGRRGRGRQLR
jgi:MFS family permease